jgi:hypothetical protein
MLRGLFWNVRGLNKKGLAPYIRDLMAENHFDFLCFQETILQEFSDKCLRKIDPGKEFLWDWVPAVGRSGGGCFLVLRLIGLMLAIGLKESLFSSILCGISSLEKWCILNVYGAA